MHFIVGGLATIVAAMILASFYAFVCVSLPGRHRRAEPFRLRVVYPPDHGGHDAA